MVFGPTELSPMEQSRDCSLGFREQNKFSASAHVCLDALSRSLGLANWVEAAWHPGGEESTSLKETKKLN